MTDRLTLAVSLAFSDSSHNSSKFHDTVWIGRTIVITFGRRGTSGQTIVKTFPTVEKAAAEYWTLLRSKAAKGYHVVGATAGLRHGFAEADALRVAAAWRTSAARGNPWRIPEGHEHVTRSPRTGKQGAAVLLELSDPNASEDALLAAAIADPSERFLYPLALSHPACPDEAKVAAVLMRPTA